MAVHDKRGVPLTIRPLTAFFLPRERAHVLVSPYGPIRAQLPILPSTAAYGKRLLKPCIRMGYVPKGMANMDNEPYYGSKGLCSCLGQLVLMPSWDEHCLLREPLAT